jgi:RimJ/RimL family protein N-acetyltransferase
MVSRTPAAVIRRTYPWTEKIGGTKFTFRLMGPDDRDALLKLAHRLTEQDLTFLRMDITSPSVVDEWIRNIERGRTITVLAESGSELVGYGSLHHNELMWTSHLGELRVLVDSEHRGAGIGRILAGEIFHIARELNLDRVICQIPAHQTRVRQMLEELGFRAEALLPRWLKDRKGNLHDLLIVSHVMDDFGG